MHKRLIVLLLLFNINSEAFNLEFFNQSNFMQPTREAFCTFKNHATDLIFRHKKLSCSVALGIIGYTGYKAYSWYDNKMSSWLLQQNSADYLLPGALRKNGKINHQSPLQQYVSYIPRDRDDPRVSIINMLAQNSSTISDILRSLHNQGESSSWKFWQRDMPCTRPELRVLAKYQGTAYLAIDVSLDTTKVTPEALVEQHGLPMDPNLPVLIRLTNLFMEHNNTRDASGNNLFEALQNLTALIIQRQEVKSESPTDMSNIWNIFCGDRLQALQIRNNGTPNTFERAEYICSTKVRDYKQPANKTIQARGKAGSLKDNAFFQRLFVECFPSVAQLHQPMPKLEQASGIVRPKNDEYQPFYHFGYHIDQFIKRNLLFIFLTLCKAQNATRDSTQVAFEGRVKDCDHTFRLKIIYEKTTRRVTVLLRNNTTRHTIVAGRKGDPQNLYLTVDQLTSHLSDEVIRDWFGTSLAPEADTQEQITTFSCQTPIGKRVVLSDPLSLAFQVFAEFDCSNEPFPDSEED